MLALHNRLACSCFLLGQPLHMLSAVGEMMAKNLHTLPKYLHWCLISPLITLQHKKSALKSLCKMEPHAHVEMGNDVVMKETLARLGSARRTGGSDEFCAVVPLLPARSVLFPRHCFLSTCPS